MFFMKMKVLVAQAIAHQASLSVGFSRQKYWSGLLDPSPGDLPDPGIKPVSLASPALAARFFTTSTTWEAHSVLIFIHIFIQPVLTARWRINCWGYYSEQTHGYPSSLMVC